MYIKNIKPIKVKNTFNELGGSLSQFIKCRKCGEILSLYGGCKCNNFTTAFVSDEDENIPQHSKEEIIEH